MALELPEHVVFVILLWLPVKSLLRLKAVCKYWYSLIESTTFIDQHLRHQQDNVNCSIIVKKSMPYVNSRYFRPRHARFYMLTGEKFDDASICLDFANEEMRRYKINSPVLISDLCVGSTCNGITCLHFREFGFEDVALWNPATRELRPLPLPDVPRPPHPRMRSYPFLGFDIKTNDYKVVKIIYANEQFTVADTRAQVEVYNLSTDSWRIINRDYILPFAPNCGMQPEVLYKNGLSFFCGDSRSEESKWKGQWVLISFDFSTEKFRFIPMPNACRWVHTHSLDFLGDNVICFNDPVSESTPIKPYNYGNDQYFDIWMLHGYGINESWSKMYTIGPFDFVEPIKFLKERKFLLLSTNSRVYLYNLVTQEMPDFYVDPNQRPAFVIYNESLVSINGENDAAHRETSLRRFARICENEPETEEDEDVTDEERVESQSEEESQDDREIKYLENQISNELDLGF